MKKLIGILTMLVICVIANAQNLYVKTFGDTKARPIIYLHGGPGYNASVFEGTTAQKLADAGYFVIVYDRRGEGRPLIKQRIILFSKRMMILIVCTRRIILQKLR